MRSFTPVERRARLGRRHFLTAESRAADIDEVVTKMVGLHATDPATPYLTLWARVPGFGRDHLHTALYDSRSVVKHLAMRRTLWMVRSCDLPTIQTVSSDRVAADERRRLIADAEKSAVAPDGAVWLDTACAAVLEHLRRHGPTSARELRAALPELAGSHDPAPGKNWGGTTPLAPRVLTVLGVRGDIVRGPNDGGWAVSRPRWTLREHWLDGGDAHVPADQGALDIVGRWLRTFGPATATDVKWWFGHTLTWARQTLRGLGAVEVDLHGGIGYVLPDDLDSEPEPEPWAALLPGLDVTTMGWFDRDWYLGEHRAEVFDRNGNGGPTAWWNGRIVGGWGQDGDGRVVVRLLEDVGRDGATALTRRADELSAWLNGARVSPRFPSPVMKA
ncbi:winged helix DNA-binding domain-containing protein [Mycolicibacterium baixiangningiae]|uniref:winged helix DNA-binding domain-containing protein n=1 Tax=Mycolicibacterium baixiangningiae TaxID=2761578 RepID=UPI0018668D50|nr:winged helix DNA-binding domain-containing protein [Mycolicibacterium baixiangningiae]